MRERTVSVSLCLSLVVLVTTSCVGFQRWQKRRTQMLREIELEDVAKSWCQTIRASQVIPLYPLTEDVQPGDVFLVQRTIDEQHEEYVRRGFLPFDYHLARLDPEGYGNFYDHSVLPGSDALLPRFWMRPKGELAPAGESWKSAPRAAFPSYSFSVKSGGGFSLALPVQGVPVGMSLLASQEAAGTISIRDAKTLGVDMLSLWAQLEDWCRRGGSLTLQDYASSGGRKAYVRIVTRIYLTGAIDVSLTSSSSAAGGLDVGAAKGVANAAAASADGTDVTKAYEQNLAAINETLQGMDGAPGGSLRVTAAGAGSISMHETFDPPLVLGYAGFDCEILPGGTLGNPCPSLVTLENPGLARRLAQADRGVAIQIDAVNKGTVDLIRYSLDFDELPDTLRRSGTAIVGGLDALARYVDEAPVYTQTLTPGTVEREQFAAADGDVGYDLFVSFRSKLASSGQKVARAMQHPPLRVIEGGGEPVPAPSGSAQLERVHNDLVAIDALVEAAPWKDAEDDGLRAARQWLVRFMADAGR